MKKIYSVIVLLIFTLLYSNLSAQISLTSSYNPTPGNVFKDVNCDSTGITEGNSGANQIWNFTNLVRRDSVAFDVVSAGSTPFATQFPNCNIASTENSPDFSYYSTSSNDFLYYGYGSTFQVNSYSNPRKLMEYPFTYNNSFTDTYSSTYFNGASNSYLNGNTNVVCDAWGTINLPNGSFNNSIRVKTINTQKDSTFIGIPTIIQFTSTTYSWYVENKKYPVLEIRYTSVILNQNPPVNSKFVSYFPENPSVGIRQLSSLVADDFSLGQNYPNPFNPSTKIRFDINSTKRNSNKNVNLKVYDAVGREVTTLVNENLSTGSYEVDWNAADLSGGAYYYTLTAGDFSETKKMILMK